MNKIAKFSKVSYEQFKKDWLDTFGNKYNEWGEEAIDKTISDIYNSIELPKRSTSGSAGHDFRSPSKLVVGINETIKIPTGIRCEIDNGWVLQCYPRSSYGFKYGVSLINTVGIVDEDYFSANNEGHIFIKLSNSSPISKSLIIEKNDAFCQGVFVPYGVTYDDDVTEVRTGGIGSTGR